MKKGLVGATVMFLQLMPLCVLRAQSDNEEGPGRGVARISVINGDVSVRRSDSGDWVAAAINAPVMVPDSVLTGAGARAEIQIDYANLVRMAANTEVRFSELENNRYQLQISRGTITFSVLRDTKADIDLSTPNVSVRPGKRGLYRVMVGEDGTTTVAVRSGEAEIFTPRGAERLEAGRAMMVRGTASDPEFQRVASSPQDEWDRWNEDRDRELSRSNVYRYVSRDVYGAEDLDGYGRWVYVAPYGWVWSPYAAAGWAPYRYGRWSWLDWYGWSWVSYDPWGWAPYHYGRWFNYGPYGWCWWPGGYGRHYWRPGLVAFFGWGGFGVGFGFGHVGWVPLAPYERYHPWYGRHHYHGYRNRGYIDNSVHVVNNVNVTNVYRNARVSNAITAVNGSDFGRGRVVNVHRGTSNDLRSVGVVRGQLPVVPQRDSLAFSDGQARAVSSRVAPDRYASRRQVTLPDRIPFSEQQQGVERVSRRIFNQGENPRAAGLAEPAAAGSQRERTSGLSGSAPSIERGTERGGTTESNSGAASPGSGVERSAGRGWRRVGEASHPESTVTPTSERSVVERGSSGEVQRTRSGSWRRSGEPATSQAEPSTSGGERTTDVIRSRGGAEPGNSPGVERSRSGSWRRFGEPGRSSETARPEADSSSGSIPGDAGAYRRRSTGDSDSSSDLFGGRTRSRSDGGFGEPSVRQGGGAEPESVLSGPSIVRERRSSRSEGRSRGEEPSRIFGGESSSGRMSESPRWGGGGRMESGGGRSSGTFGGGRSGGTFGGSRSGGTFGGGGARSGGDGGGRSGGSSRSSGGGRSGRSR
jgi:hypothetical protein